MRINETLYSIQGEGKNMNVPTAFIRFQGCNLNPGCKWCDTKYARNDGGTDMTIEEILKDPNIVAVRRQAVTRQPHICITGGEPLSHDSEVSELVKTLHRRGYYIEIFTNGTLPIPMWGSDVDSFVVDVKCPSSGVTSPYAKDWFDARTNDQIKFVVADEVDIAYVESLKPFDDCWPEVLISPMIPVSSEVIGLKELEWARRVIEFCKTYGYRFSLQEHKILWGNRRGV